MGGLEQNKTKEMILKETKFEKKKGQRVFIKVQTPPRFTLENYREVLFFAGVGFTPADLYFEPHVFFALNAFRLLVPGTFFYLIVLIRQKMHISYQNE